MKYTYQIHPLVEQDFEEGYIWYEKEIYITSIHHTKKHPRKKYRK